jgi:hypothetical protein
MRFFELCAALLVAPLVAAHGDMPGMSNIIGLDYEEVAVLNSREVFGGQVSPVCDALIPSVDGTCGDGFTCLGK